MDKNSKIQERFLKLIRQIPLNFGLLFYCKQFCHETKDQTDKYFPSFLKFLYQTKKLSFSNFLKNN